MTCSTYLTKNDNKQDDFGMALKGGGQKFRLNASKNLAGGTTPIALFLLFNQNFYPNAVNS
ncbi:hypothetical protein [uncultured Bartonella sp.]|uniref:hypothetical protein n=1 Tax=uncultured Bartonella sp. TaxID=104108 RepID=UPI0025E5C52E|nr:hypothetical protein [uncultured Bartonella sp.]